MAEGEQSPDNLGSLVAGLVETQLHNLRDLLETPEAKQACLAALRELNCPPLVGRAAFPVFKALILIGAKLGPGAAGTIVESGIRTLINRVPVFIYIIRILAKAIGRVDAKVKLRQFMLDEIKESGFKPGDIRVDQATPMEVVEALHINIEFEKVRHELHHVFAEISSALEEQFAGLNEPQLAWPALTDGGGVLDSLNYATQRDEFVGRGDEEGVLWRFLGEATSDQNRFRWMLLTGRGGEGKSRLAFELVQKSQPFWRAGRLFEDQLEKFNPALWAPRLPTLIVIDYALHWPKELRGLLRGLAQRAADFEYPVRILLIAREETRDWIDEVVPPGSTGEQARRARYIEAVACPGGNLRLRPVGRDDLIRLMVRRFEHRRFAPPPNELLWAAAERLDAQPEQTSAGVIMRPPRPLFAAVAAEALMSAAEHADDLSIQGWKRIVRSVEKEEAFNYLILRDRANFWQVHDAPDTVIEQRRLQYHQNALVVTTMALGHLSPAVLATAAQSIPAASVYLPAVGQGQYDLDLSRFQRMAGQAARDLLGALEPDILGEYFVLRRLYPTDSEGRSEPSEQLVDARALIDTAWKAAPRDVAAFLRRTYSDFPERLKQTHFLLPSTGIADDWAVKLLRSLIADLHAASSTLHRSKQEKERLSADQRDMEARERRRLAIEATRLAARVRGIVSAMGIVADSVVEEAALAWETAAYLASTISMPDLVDGDLRFVPAFGGSQDIERPRAAVALLADFRSAMAILNAEPSLEPPRSMLGDSNVLVPSGERVPQDHLNGALLEAPSGGAISVADALSMLDWVGSLVESRTGSEGDRAWRAASRSVLYICNGVGDTASCESLGKLALERIRSSDDAPIEILSADLRVLHAASWSDAMLAQRAVKEGDKKAEEVPQARLHEIWATVMSIAPERLRMPLAQRAVGNIVRNTCIALPENVQVLLTSADYMRRCLELHPDGLLFSQALGMALAAYCRHLGYKWSTDVAEAESEYPDPATWSMIDKAWGQLRQCVEKSASALDDHDRPQLFETWHALALTAVLQSYLTGQGADADYSLSGALSCCESRLADGWDDSIIVDLAQTSGPLLLLQVAASTQWRQQWFDWLLEPRRATRSLEGIVSATVNLLPSHRIGEADFLDQLRVVLDRHLSRSDRPTRYYPLSPSIHEAIGDAILAFASQAYAAADAVLFDHWAELLERPGRCEQAAFAGHLAQLATLRLSLSEEEAKELRPLDSLATSGNDEAWQGDTALLFAAYYRAERSGRTADADAILDRLMTIGNAANESGTR